MYFICWSDIHICLMKWNKNLSYYWRDTFNYAHFRFYYLGKKNIKLFLIRRIDFDHINSSAPSTFCIYVMNWKNWNVKSILQYKSILQVNINLEPLFINCMKAVRLSFNMVCIKGIFILPTTKSEWFKLTSSVKFFDVSQKWQKKCKKYVSKCH